MSMSYVGLDMRNPKKCMSVDYPGTTMDVIYEIFGEFLFFVFRPYKALYCIALSKIEAHILNIILCL